MREQLLTPISCVASLATLCAAAALTACAGASLHDLTARASPAFAFLVVDVLFLLELRRGLRAELQAGLAFAQAGAFAALLWHPATAEFTGRFAGYWLALCALGQFGRPRPPP